jgi:trehalose 6-phosphate synthase/phosphatase
MTERAPRPDGGIASGQLVIASNRLPVRLVHAGGAVRLEPSSGGLVAALGAISEPFSWIGWPGAVVPSGEEEGLRGRLADKRLHPVLLDQEEEADFYGSICNDTLWPLFHSFVDRLRFTTSAWQRYVAVNERFADAIAAHSPPGARVWVHDFHLMLVPAALRERRPDLSIGFFLHTPFPASEVYRLLPVREEVLLGLLGADYLGFHTGDYVHHFRSACLRVLGLECELDVVQHRGRTVQLGADPIGIDVARFRGVLAESETRERIEALDERYAGKRLVLGVERLDYTKGITQKLRAFERYLEDDPGRAATTTMLQVLVPSRLESRAYRVQRDEIELEIARINHRFGCHGRTPVEYLDRSVSPAELVALYRRADVMAVTPLRDGMNLVAQEFALCQAAAPDVPSHARGVLLLSEFAGAAQSLPGAVLVNPWDSADVSARLAEALEVAPAERLSRLELMEEQVVRLDAPQWAVSFLDRLAQAARHNRRRGIARPLDRSARAELLGRAARASHRTLLLDYDGTLREIVSHPSLACPTPGILALLEALAALPSTEVHIVSGRSADDLDAWLGHLPVALCAEHGYRSRRPGGEWETLQDVDLGWLPCVERLFREVADEVPGSLVEGKAGGVAWHYRQAAPEYAEWRARELLVAVRQLLHGAPAEVRRGHRVIEVRARGVSKGAYVRALFPEGRLRRHFVLSAGDDETDVDVVAAVPPGSIAIHVGRALATPRETSARDQLVVASPQDLRALLRGVLSVVGRQSRRCVAG